LLPLIFVVTVTRPNKRPKLSRLDDCTVTGWLDRRSANAFLAAKPWGWQISGASTPSMRIRTGLPPEAGRTQSVSPSVTWVTVPLHVALLVALSAALLGAFSAALEENAMQAASQQIAENLEMRICIKLVCYGSGHCRLATLAPLE
jgi:hypothetical protein